MGPAVLRARALIDAGVRRVGAESLGQISDSRIAPLADASELIILPANTNHGDIPFS